MKQIMVDIETLGTQSDAAIIAIGAVEFNLKSKELGTEFYCTCIPDTKNFSVDFNTVKFWIEQKKDVAGETFKGECDIVQALFRLHNYLLGSDSDGIIWANGASFDFPILANHYRHYDIALPWKFWNERCFRTYKNLFPKDMPKNDYLHNALEDAKWQARYLMQ